MSGLFSSKKFVAALVAALVAFIAAYFGFSPEKVMAVISPLLAYIGAQGIADLGKERAKIEAESFDVVETDE